MKNKSQSGKTEKKGFSVLAVLIFVTLSAAIAASVLSSSTAELRINSRNLMMHEARNTAEALQEYAVAEIIRLFKNDASIGGSTLKTSVNSVPSSATTLFANTNVDLTGCDIGVGDLSTPSFSFIPSNEDRNDPLAGKNAFSRTATILTKAKVTKEGIIGGDYFAYAAQTFELRDAPLFTHAIFYNMDLVVAPGPNMDVYGPVHSNRHLAVESSNQLNFHDKVSIAGDFYVGHKMTNWTFHTSSYDAVDVAFANDTGTLVDVYNGGTTSSVSSYTDSRTADWEEVASQNWGGMLEDSAHGAPVLNPVAIDDYEPDDPTTPDNELENHAYALIEPLRPWGDADRKIDNTRKEKFAMKAGLLLKVVKDGTKASGYAIHAYKYDRSTANSLLPTLDTTFQNPTLTEIDLPPGLIGDANSAMTDIDLDGEPEVYAKETGLADNDVTAGWYDRRQQQQLNIVSLDIGKLKTIVDDGTGWDNPGSSNPIYNPSWDWNGVVYVEFPTVAGSGGRSDKIVVADTEPSATGTGSGVTPGIALALIDGGTLPDDGLTVATNGAMYVVGHYNSDNDATDSNSARATDPNEVPAAIVADSVTLLSGNWPVEGRENSDENRTNSNRNPSHTEWAFGLISGYTPADATTSSGDKNWGGGVQNLPRFLESWNSSTTGGKGVATIRGSLVSLFESEVQTKPYLINSSLDGHFAKWFKAPTRNWGFADLFKNNDMPPGTPSVRHPRATDLTFLSKDEFTTLKTSLGVTMN